MRLPQKRKIGSMLDIQWIGGSMVPWNHGGSKSFLFRKSGNLFNYAVRQLEKESGLDLSSGH
jgi:hypothetical protein